MHSTSSRSHACGRLIPSSTVVLALLLASCGGGGYGSSGSMTPPLAPTVNLSIAPTTVTAGQTATLTWSTNNATSCTASGGWTGTEATSGTQAVTPTASGNVAYTLACTAPTGGGYSGGGGGTTSMSVTLTVNAASTYSFTNLVADTAGTGAQTTDANLLNPWGVVFGPGTPVWVANNHSETSTLYDGNGKPVPAATPLIVNTPAPGGGGIDPTGIVFNSSSTDFMITSGANTGPARFIFTGESGMIAGWNNTVDLHNAVVAYPAAGGNTGGAIYKGLAIAKNGNALFLYATDFHNNKVDVFDTTFAKQTLAAGAFVDSTLPAGYAPFGIQAIANGTNGATQIYVTYAKQDANAQDNVNGAGLGLVDIYDPAGKFVKHLLPTGGLLNAPWGIALAPSDFGTLSNALLIGNFGDGKISGFDPASGAFVGTVINSTGSAFADPGLWGIAFGNDAVNQPHNTLFFAAGLNDEANGVYGRIDLGNPPALGTPPSVTLTVPAGNLTGSVMLSATATDTVPLAKISFYANGALIGAATSSPYTVSFDTTKVTNGTVAIVAVALDTAGNVGSSAASVATVAN